MQTKKKEVQKPDVMQRIISIDAAIAELGEADGEVIRLKKLQSVFDDPKDHLVNYQTAIVLVRAINEKREPNWDDSSECKYQNWFEMGSSGFRCDGYDLWDANSDVGSRLCFFDPKHGKYLANQFPDVFKHFMLIVKE